MKFPTYSEVKKFDETYGTKWLASIEEMCRLHTRKGEPGPYYQFRTDWINKGLLFALAQTLEYVGYGYADAMVFKDVGSVLGLMLKDFESKGVY
jgi:hypothetical protein